MFPRAYKIIIIIKKKLSVRKKIKMPLCCGLFFLLTGKRMLEDTDVQERNITGKEFPLQQPKVFLAVNNRLMNMRRSKLEVKEHIRWMKFNVKCELNEIQSDFPSLLKVHICRSSRTLTLNHIIWNRHVQL